MTVSVKVSVGPDEPRGANFEVQSQGAAEGPGEKWTPAEVGTIAPGTHKVFVLHAHQRFILSE